MILFHNDYSEGCHEKVLDALVKTNSEQTPGYGEDVYCARAAAKIRKYCGREDLGVHFLVGGTQANMTVIAAALRPHQGVLAADSGHINVHETGAIEATGHKVMTVPSDDGKITAQNEILLYGGTDTSVLQAAGIGAYAGCISIPSRYIHSGVEMIDLRDVAACTDLALAFALDPTL